MKLRQAELEGDISSLNEKIETIKEEGSKEKEELQKSLSDKELNLIETRQKLKNAESKMNGSVLSGLTSTQYALGTNSHFYGSNFLNNTCGQCGKLHLSSVGFSDNLCSSCRTNRGLFVKTKT